MASLGAGAAQAGVFAVVMKVVDVFWPDDAKKQRAAMEKARLQQTKDTEAYRESRDRLNDRMRKIAMRAKAADDLERKNEHYWAELAKFRKANTPVSNGRKLIREPRMEDYYTAPVYIQLMEAGLVIAVIGGAVYIGVKVVRG